MRDDDYGSRKDISTKGIASGDIPGTVVIGACTRDRPSGRSLVFQVGLASGGTPDIVVVGAQVGSRGKTLLS